MGGHQLAAVLVKYTVDSVSKQHYHVIENKVCVY